MNTSIFSNDDLEQGPNMSGQSNPSIFNEIGERPDDGLSQYSVSDALDNDEFKVPQTFLEERKMSVEKPKEMDEPESSNDGIPTQTNTKIEVVQVPSQEPSKKQEDFTPVLEKYLKRLEDIVVQNSQAEVEPEKVTEKSVLEQVNSLVLQTTTLIEKATDFEKETNSLITNFEKSNKFDASESSNAISTNSRIEIERENRIKEGTHNQQNNSIFQNTESTNVLGITPNSYVENLTENYKNNYTSLHTSPIALQSIQEDQDGEPVSKETNSSSHLERTNMSIIKPETSVINSNQTIQIQTAIQDALKNMQASAGNNGMSLVFQTNSNQTKEKSESVEKQTVSSSSTSEKIKTQTPEVENNDGMATQLLLAIHEALVSGTLKVRIES